MATGTIKTNGWKLLWTNPNPTAQFANSKAEFDTTGYTWFMFEFSIRNDNPYSMAFQLRADSTTGIFISSYTGKTIERTLLAGWLSSTGITFNSGVIYNSYGGGGVDNHYLIPTRIYGIKA